jgi:NAD(P)-dependent dehydrogenase (short-subunit alcohol dehydrogenase family)
VVTGANSGIGLGMARGLATAGASVAVWARRDVENARAVDTLDMLGSGTPMAVRCDVGDEDAVTAAMAMTLERYGRVDSCFANAGVTKGPPAFTEMETDEWRRVLRVNLDGAFFTLRAAARHMMEREGGGSLVVTASLAVTHGFSRYQHYAASKGAVMSMVRSLAVELGPHGVRANAVLPGYFSTPVSADLDEQRRARILSRIPMARQGAPDELGGLAVYLAGPASSYQTGASIVVDGGYSVA